MIELWIFVWRKCLVKSNMPALSLLHFLIKFVTLSQLRGWDLRNTTAPVFSLEGHQYAVRRVKVRCFVLFIDTCRYAIMEIMLNVEMKNKIGLIKRMLNDLFSSHV